MSHYKAARLTETTQRAAGRHNATGPEKHVSTLRKAILIILVGAFAFMAASAVAIL